MNEQDGTRQTNRSPRDAILDSALALFSEKGFASTTTKEIAAKAGVNEVTIFRNFGSKMGLFESVISSRFPHTRISLDVHFDRSSPPEVALLANARSMLMILKDEREIFTLLSSDLPRLNVTGRYGQALITSSFLTPLRAYLQTQVEKGLVRQMDPDMAAQTFYGMIYSHFLLNYVVGRVGLTSKDEERYLKNFVEIFLTGVGTKDLKDEMAAPSKIGKR